MTHKYNEILRGITLPGKFGIVTGRVHNWLSEKSDDIEPVSCWVIGLEYPTKYTALNVCDLFKKLAWKLQANAGVNVCLEGLDSIIKELQSFNYATSRDIVHSGSVECIDRNVENKDTGFIDGYYKVADSLRLESATSKAKFPDHISIYDAWIIAWQSILKGEHIILDFSEVRDVDDYSSGRDSFIEIIRVMETFLDKPSVLNFLSILSSINGCIKRGGFRKHGAVTTCLKANDPRIEEYLDIPFGQLPYVKKAIAFENLPSIDLLETILQKYNNGELFLDKYFGTNANGIELRSNVCRGIFLSPDDQCLIAHVNMGMIDDIADIPKAFHETTSFLIDVFNLQEALGYKTIDRQIAVGIVGLANFLRMHRVTYQEFIDAMVLFNRGFYKGDSLAFEIVTALQIGFKTNARLAQNNNLRASLTIEPSESCARRYKDSEGFDLCPNIDPPDVVAGIGIERRHSQTGIKDEEGNDITPIFNYGTGIQVATELTSKEHFYLWNEMQIMMDQTGKQHAASYEHWNLNTPLDLISFFEWYKSNLKTLYYFRQIGTKHLHKGTSISSARKKWKSVMQQNESCVINTVEHCAACGD